MTITLDNSHCDAICNLANIYKVIGKANDAKNKYLDAIRIDPKCAIAWSNLGGVFYDNGDFEQAVKCYQHAIAITPDFADAYSNMGNALLQLGKLSGNDGNTQYFIEARKQYLRAQELRPDFALPIGNLGLLEMICNTSTKVSCYETGAERLLRQALLQDSNYYDALNNLATCYFEQKRFDECIKLCLRVLKYRPDHYYVYHNLANALKEKGLYAASAFAFNVANFLKELPDTKCGLASLLMESGRVTQSLNILNDSSELFGKRHEALLLHNLGVAYIISMNTDEAKIKLTHQYVREWEYCDAAMYNLSILFQRQGDLDNAMKYTQAVSVEASSISHYTSPLNELMGLAICKWSKYEDQSSLYSSIQLKRPEQIYTQYYCKHSASLEIVDGKRIRIGYIYDSFSKTDLMEIPNMHDLSTFDVKLYPISYNQTHGVAKRIYEDMIQILVLLDESPSPSFQDIFKANPAPVQISFNLPLNEGGDRYVTNMNIGLDSIAMLLPSPYVNNGQLDTVPHRTSDSVSNIRSKYDISDDCFVYASFCLPFHIDEATFKMWMNILGRASESAILLLMRYNDHMESEIRKKADSFKVDQNRIVFIDPSITSQYEKYFLVDLYLDTTTKVGDNTSLCEALLMGTPMICYENSNKTPKAATLIRNIGLGYQVVSSCSEYEKLAIQLEYDDENYIHIVKILDEEKKSKRGIFDDLFRSKWISSYETMLASKASELMNGNLSI